MLAFGLKSVLENIDLVAISAEGKPRRREEPLKQNRIRKYDKDAGRLI